MTILNVLGCEKERRLCIQIFIYLNEYILPIHAEIRS